MITKTTNRCPLEVTKDAEKAIRKKSLNAGFKPDVPVRVTQHVVDDDDNPRMVFDVSFDADAYRWTRPKSKVYKVGKIYVALDQDTAVELIGSQMILKDGEVALSHQYFDGVYPGNGVDYN